MSAVTHYIVFLLFFYHCVILLHPLHTILLVLPQLPPYAPTSLILRTLYKNKIKILHVTQVRSSIPSADSKRTTEIVSPVLLLKVGGTPRSSHTTIRNYLVRLPRTPR